MVDLGWPRSTQVNLGRPRLLLDASICRNKGHCGRFACWECLSGLAEFATGRECLAGPTPTHSFTKAMTGPRIMCKWNSFSLLRNVEMHHLPPGSKKCFDASIAFEIMSLHLLTHSFDFWSMISFGRLSTELLNSHGCQALKFRVLLNIYNCSAIPSNFVPAFFMKHFSSFTVSFSFFFSSIFQQHFSYFTVSFSFFFVKLFIISNYTLYV